jgi:hypothetical protein
MRFHALLAVMRCPCDILCFLLHNFRTRYPDEIYAFLGRYDLCVSFHLEKIKRRQEKTKHDTTRRYAQTRTVRQYYRARQGDIRQETA